MIEISAIFVDTHDMIGVRIATQVVTGKVSANAKCVYVI